MATVPYAQRREKLLRSIKKEKVDAMLITSETNVSWLTGFRGDSSWLLLSPNLTMLISDTRYTIQIQEECPGLEMFIRDSKMKMSVALGKVLPKTKFSSIAYESHVVKVSELETLDKANEKLQAEWVPKSSLVEKLRMIKDATEIAEIREAVRLAQRGFSFLTSSLTGCTTEREAAHNLEHAMRKFGAHSAAFEPIVAVGERAALPHAIPTEKRIEEAPFVLIDWGAKTESGYRSDLTRTLITSKSSSKFEKVYNTVLKAQEAGIKAIRPGVPLKDVDAAARKVIEDAGFGKKFGHGLGHGIGLDIHEDPRMSAIVEGEVKAGMVVTVEPGIYITGWGGVRIEDDVLVTRNGHEVLTSVPKGLEHAMIEV